MGRSKHAKQILRRKQKFKKRCKQQIRTVTPANTVTKKEEIQKQNLADSVSSHGSPLTKGSISFDEYESENPKSKLGTPFDKLTRYSFHTCTFLYQYYE